MDVEISHQRLSKQSIHQAKVLTKLVKDMEKFLFYRMVTKKQSKILSNTMHVLLYLGSFIMADIRTQEH